MYKTTNKIEEVLEERLSRSKGKAIQTRVIISNGQYETAAITANITHKTISGLYRRARQLSREHSVYGDNWAGWINAKIAIATPGRDIWGDNNIIGGSWCEPYLGWLDL